MSSRKTMPLLITHTYDWAIFFFRFCLPQIPVSKRPFGIIGTWKIIITIYEKGNVTIEVFPVTVVKDDRNMIDLKLIAKAFDKFLQKLGWHLLKILSYINLKNFLTFLFLNKTVP